MPIEFIRNPEGTIAVAYCFGELSEADISNSISFAFGSGQAEPGLDRIVTFDPATKLHELDTTALRSIQRRVLEFERRNGREACFRSVLVYSSPMQQHLMQLYKAIWDELGLPGVEFFVVASEEEAWKLLDSVPLALRRGAD